MFSVLKFLFRLLGYALLAVAIIAGIADASSSIALSQLRLAPLGEVWSGLSPASLALTEAFVREAVHPALWDHVAGTLLTLPVWAVLAPLGLLLLALGSRRQRPRALYA